MALAGDILSTIMAFRSLITYGVAPALILWAITREVRLLLQVANKENNLQILPYKLVIMKKALSRLSIKHLEGLLEQASTIDMIMKGMRSGVLETDLLNLCLSLANSDYPIKVGVYER